MTVNPPSIRPGRRHRRRRRPGLRRALSCSAVLGLVLQLAACELRPPVPIPPTVAAQLSSSQPGSVVPSTAESGGLDGFVAVRADRLEIGDRDGDVREVPGPGGRIEAASIANGRVVAQTAGPTFQLATLDSAAGAVPAWQKIDVEVPNGLLGVPVLSPDGGRLALAGGRVGSGLPVRVIVVTLQSGATISMEVEREPDGPITWLDDSTLLLEVVPDGGARFVRLDLGGKVTPTRGAGYGPALSGDRAAVAVVRDEIVVQPTADWLAGADGGERVRAVSNAVRIALDSRGIRLAVEELDDDGAPIALLIFERRDAGWVLVHEAPDPPEWFGWLR